MFIQHKSHKNPFVEFLNGHISYSDHNLHIGRRNSPCRLCSHTEGRLDVPRWGCPDINIPLVLLKHSQRANQGYSSTFGAFTFWPFEGAASAVAARVQTMARTEAENFIFFFFGWEVALLEAVWFGIGILSVRGSWYFFYEIKSTSSCELGASYIDGFWRRPSELSVRS